MIQFPYKRQSFLPIKPIGGIKMIKIHLSRLLGEKKWTQADLSRKTGIRPNTISALFHEFTDRVNLQHLDKICEVLGCELHELIEYVPAQSNKDKRNK